MSRVLYSYKFRLIPTKSQEILLNKHFGATRFVYNYFLAIRQEVYRTENKTLNYYDNCRTLTDMKKVVDTGWLKEINSQSLQFSVKTLDTSFDRFFKRKGGYPNFHSKFDKASFRVPSKTRVADGKVYIPKFLDGIRLVQHQEIEGTIKFSTISKTPSGEYYISITVERDISEPTLTNKAVGIDLGIKDLLICSDGKVYKNPKNTYIYQAKLKKLQRYLSRKVKGSSRRNKARIEVAKVHKRITNKRVDNIHKATTDIIRNNDIIVIETLRPKNMVRNHKLAKAISDASFGEIVRQLEYKSKWYGKALIKLNQFYPSSKTCNHCGWINQSLTLKDREWDCSQCARKLNRDLNAAHNILDEGLRSISAGTVEYTCGANIRPIIHLIVDRQMAMKREASML